MIALPVVSAAIGILLGIARCRVTALLVVLGTMMVSLTLCAVVVGAGVAGTVVSGIVAAAVLQTAYVLTLAVRACGPASHGETPALGVAPQR